MATMVAENRKTETAANPIYIGIPGPGEIGREEILEALRRAGIRSERIRRQAADAARQTAVCQDRRFAS